MGLGVLIGRGMEGRSTGHRTSMKVANKENRTKGAGKYTLNFVSLHERTGSRGNGIGMGRRNQRNPTKYDF
jgi:hypothetical protein